MVGARYSKLEALTVTLLASGSFACAAFSMLHVNCTFSCYVDLLFQEGIRIAFHDVSFRLFNEINIGFTIGTPRAEALFIASHSFRKTLTV